MLRQSLGRGHLPAPALLLLGSGTGFGDDGGPVYPGHLPNALCDYVVR